MTLQHPSVDAVGVIGVPHEIDGERARAFVVKKRGSEVTEEDIVQYVASKFLICFTGESWRSHRLGKPDQPIGVMGRSFVAHDFDQRIFTHIDSMTIYQSSF